MKRVDLWSILSLWVSMMLIVSGCAQRPRSISEADASLNRGVAYEKKGQHDVAIKYFTQAIKLHPRYAAAYYNRGISYGRKGLHDLAITDFTKAMEIDPRDPATHYNRGISYGIKGQFDRAIADFTEAIEINPDYAGAYLNRAAVYFSKSDYDKAWDDVHRVQDLGYQVPQRFLRALREASGRQR